MVIRRERPPLAHGHPRRRPYRSSGHTARQRAHGRRHVHTSRRRATHPCSSLPRKGEGLGVRACPGLGVGPGARSTSLAGNPRHDLPPPRPKTQNPKPKTLDPDGSNPIRFESAVAPYHAVPRFTAFVRADTTFARARTRPIPTVLASEQPYGLSLSLAREREMGVRGVFGGGGYPKRSGPAAPPRRPSSCRRGSSRPSPRPRAPQA